MKGTLYGTTFAGGSNDYGTVFSFDPSTGAENVLYSFCYVGNCVDGAYSQAALVNVYGALYGTTTAGGTTNPCINGNPGCGTVFSLDLNTGTEKALHSFSCTQQNCTDGWAPQGSLIDVKRVLYGTTGGGGGTACHGYGCGTVFSVNRKTGAEKILYSFCGQKNCQDGAGPSASLLAVNGELYGTTVQGGAHGYGTVFVLKKL